MSPEPASHPPLVSVVIATRDRPELLRRAVASVVTQDYPGPVECIVVYDRSPAEPALAVDDPHRSVVVTTNDRTPGLAGARNCGVLLSGGTLVAFCDDDDHWRPDKLTRQVSELNRTGADVVVCGIEVQYEGRATVRVPSTDQVTHAALVRRRVMEAHPSTVVVRRAAFLGDIGLVDEEIPGGYGEDYDWILRAAESARIAVVSAPLVTVLWHRGSFFAQRWRVIIEALDHLVAKHPALRRDRQGLARIYGQQAFAYAALGQRGCALRRSRQALGLNWRERRAYLAVLVGLRILPVTLVLHAANGRGRGI